MKYKHQITIEQSRDEVIHKFDDPENMKHWQPGLVKYEHLSGTPGTVGATMKLSYTMGKRHIEMIETITKRNLPFEFDGTYEAKNVFNEVKNRFDETAEGHTLWTAENEFRFSGIMKLMGWLMPGAFKKQSYKYMQDFKAFVENNTSVANQ